MARDVHGSAAAILVACIVACSAACCSALTEKKRAAWPSSQAVLAALRGGGGIHAATSHVSKASSFVREMDVAHKLRVCNAYPGASDVSVYRAGELLTEPTLPYKSCRDLEVQLQPDDRLEFQFEGSIASAGAFQVSELPARDAVLMLVIYRHDSVSTAVAFESHVFANLANAQIAVVDTYKGAVNGSLYIEDVNGAATKRSEELRYNSVVAVNPGKYVVSLRALIGPEDTRKLGQQELVALSGESYLVLRCGVQAEVGEPYPAELMVFPQSDPTLLGSFGRRTFAITSSITSWLLLTVSVFNSS